MIYTVATSNVNNAVQLVSSRKQPFTKFKGSSRSSSSASPTTFMYFKGTAIFFFEIYLDRKLVEKFVSIHALERRNASWCHFAITEHWKGTTACSAQRSKLYAKNYITLCIFSEGGYLKGIVTEKRNYWTRIRLRTVQLPQRPAAHRAQKSRVRTPRRTRQRMPAGSTGGWDPCARCRKKTQISMI